MPCVSRSLAVLALVAAGFGALAPTHAEAQGARPVRVRVQTELGDIVLELDAAKAPKTTANFLKYVDAVHYDGGTFHRTVKMDNQPESPIKIEVIQAGVHADKAKAGFEPIKLERTSATGLLHKDGAVSMARGTADSATSGWFICINDQPSLDFGGQRNPDGQGFAAFGRVVSGMDVVRKIQHAPSSPNRTGNTEAQKLTPPITVVKVARVTSIGLDPRAPNAHNNLGIALAQQARLHARASFERALALDPSHVNARRNLERTMAILRTGRP